MSTLHHLPNHHKTPPPADWLMRGQTQERWERLADSYRPTWGPNAMPRPLPPPPVPPRDKPLFRDTRTCCYYAKCDQLTTGFFCSPACEQAFLTMLDRWDTYRSPETAPTHYTHTAADSTVIQLGNKAVADAQAARDGDLVRLVCEGRA